MNKRVYIAGPMRGIPLYNFPAFDAAAADLRFRGFHPVSPAELDRNSGFDPADLPAGHDWATLPDGFDLRDAVGRDGAALLNCDAIYMLDGWQKSKGARAEKAIADWLGLEWINPPKPETVLEEALRITSGDRDGDYGHPADHWALTVGMINARFGTAFKPQDWGVLMILDKVARDAHRTKRDNLVDVCGYARCIERVRERCQ